MVNNGLTNYKGSTDQLQEQNLCKGWKGKFSTIAQITFKSNVSKEFYFSR